MEALFSKDYMLLWLVALAAALFFPVRHLIWVLYVRRASKAGEVDETERQRLKLRAGFTAALLCLAFAFLYTQHLFQTAP